MKNIYKIVNNIHDAWDIDEVIDIVRDAAGVRVWFDDSRAWSLYSEDKPEAEQTPGYANKYGAYRPYLGGGVRGKIETNLTGDLGTLFTVALEQIEAIINEDTAVSEVWEQNTGVLLD